MRTAFIKHLSMYIFYNSLLYLSEAKVYQSQAYHFGKWKRSIYWKYFSQKTLQQEKDNIIYIPLWLSMAMIIYNDDPSVAIVVMFVSTKPRLRTSILSKPSCAYF